MFSFATALGSVNYRVRGYVYIYATVTTSEVLKIYAFHCAVFIIVYFIVGKGVHVLVSFQPRLGR
jgi:hypothetical protein